MNDILRALIGERLVDQMKMKKRKKKKRKGN
jgi:hypothetical protein